MVAAIRDRGKSSDMRLWDWTAEREVASYDGMNCGSDVVFSPDGGRMAFVDAAHVFIFDLVDNRLVHKLPHQDGGFASWLAFSPDGRKLAISGAGFPRLRIWDCGKGTQDKVISQQAGGFMGVSWTKNGNSLVTIGPKSGVSFIDLDSGTIYRQSGKIPKLAPVVRQSLAVSADEKHVVVGAPDLRVHVWDCIDFKTGVLKGCWAPALSRDGQLLASACLVNDSQIIAIWEFKSVCLELK